MRCGKSLMSEGVNLMDDKQLCKLRDAKAYIDGLMEEVPENSPAWEALNGAWCILEEAISAKEM